MSEMPLLLTKPGDGFYNTDGQNGLKVQEVVVEQTPGEDASASTLAMVHLFTDLAKTPGIKPQSTVPVYGVDYALYDCHGNRMPTTGVVPPGNYLLACRPELYGLKPEATFAPFSVASFHYYKSDGKMLKKTTFTNGLSQIETVHWIENLGPNTTVALKHPGLEGDAQTGFRRKPRPRELFDTREMARDKWAWTVVRRTLMTVHSTLSAHHDDNDPQFVWSDWSTTGVDKPYGFGDKVSAVRRKLWLMRRDAHNLKLGIAEYEVRPHYIGYNGEGESWYSKTWEMPPDPETSINGPLFSKPS
jgi:hypothetical protein